MSTDDRVVDAMRRAFARIRAARGPAPTVRLLLALAQADLDQALDVDDLDAYARAFLDSLSPLEAEHLAQPEPVDDLDEDEDEDPLDPDDLTQETRR